MKPIRRNPFALLLAAALAACNASPEEKAVPLVTIGLSNPSGFARPDEITTLDLESDGANRAVHASGAVSLTNVCMAGIEIGTLPDRQSPDGRSLE